MNFNFFKVIAGITIACSLALPQRASAQDDLQSVINTASTLRRAGNLYRALELLEAAQRSAGPNPAPMLAGELGLVYYQARRFDEAQAKLKEAYDLSTVVAERARYANDLGNMNASRGRNEEAKGFFEEARNASGVDAAVVVGAGLNLARLAPQERRLDELTMLYGEIAEFTDEQQRARYFLNLGSQARDLKSPALKLAYESLDQARTLAGRGKDSLLQAEVLDELAQLYEDQRRAEDALALTDQALATLPAEQGRELAIALHWRRARLAGNEAESLRAYQVAVEQIEAIRQDIPIEYVDGRSSFRETLEPIYLGLADSLLRKAVNSNGDARLQAFRRARDAVELIKQSELQDYLGERCSIDSATSLASSSIPERTAVIYPVMLADRLELLIETRQGIDSRQVPIGAVAMREKAQGLAKSLRDAGLDYLIRAQELHKLLLQPLDDLLTQNKIEMIVVVPDGALRLIPFGALHDGERFAVEKYGVVIAPGLTIAGAAPTKQQGKVLLAGVSEPGPVVEKLPETVVEELAFEDTQTRSAALRKKLALPSVKQEIEALKGKTRSQALLDSEFTVARFREQVNSGDYQVVHVASHAMFNRQASMSFIMAYDDILTIDDLQKLLRGDSRFANPIDMLTLSACQTAEGDDRAPLGIAGAVLKARANSALGSLWPVADDATKALMVRFYELLASGKMSKGQALQRAQIELRQNPEFEHPYFWAPFILVGGWL